MAAVQAFGGEKLLNFILKKIYNQPNNGFSGNGNSNGFRYSYSVTTPPTCNLISNQNNHNFEILLNVNVNANNNILNFDQDIPMVAKGRFRVVEGNLTIVQLNVSSNSQIPINQAIVTLINLTVLPPLRSRLNSIPLPRLNDIYGSGLSLALNSANVVNQGPCIEANLRVIGASGLADATTPTTAELITLNTAATNRIIATVSDDVVQHLARGIINQIDYSFEKTNSALGFKARIKGKIIASRFRFDIMNGVGTAKIKIGFISLKGGIKAPIGGWKEVNIPKPEVDLTITNSLSVSGNRVIVTLTGLDNLSIDLNFPALLLPVETLLETLINVIYRAFHRKISDLIEGTKFEIFRLSSNLFGGRLDVNLNFEPNGLAYLNNSIKAIINVN